MFAFASGWSAVLVNAGIIGIVIETLSGRVSRRWLILPVAFYGGYFAFALQERLVLKVLTASNDGANAQVSAGFDPEREALVFDGYLDAVRFVPHYGVPVVYSVRSDYPSGYAAHRLVEAPLCEMMRHGGAIRNAARIQVHTVYDDRQAGRQRVGERFCVLSMPEKPELPHVQISRNETKTYRGTLPVTKVTTGIAMPDGRHFEVVGGDATPLWWLPAPAMGCALNSARPSWQCFAGFARGKRRPIVSGTSRARRDSLALAVALGFKPVAPSDRQASDTKLVLEKIALAKDAAITRQFDILDTIIADPLARVKIWWVELAANRPEALISRADALMSGIERAASVTEEKKRERAGKNGQVIAQLLAGLPRDSFVEFGPRLLFVYSQADNRHWLWDAKPLLARLGDLGADALPYLLNPRALPSRLDKAVAGVEGLCRVGEAARAEAVPILLEMWSKSHDFHREERAVLFVAMRRIGISPPPLSEDKNGLFAELQAEWADVTPHSPSRVCSVSADRQARQEEDDRGLRLDSLE
ncbi:hypothetical protein [Stappia sediminis]|nr:hypothetical protein [Stappia sediminis]